mmetsp:Transcript_24686/g.34487  ORF Transcript_24686/g.34487 Transcript_24686/m.34487 type:complete len:117 (+) Transcript_24686:1420-1770(+)
MKACKSFFKLILIKKVLYSSHTIYENKKYLNLAHQKKFYSFRDLLGFNFIRQECLNLFYLSNKNKSFFIIKLYKNYSLAIHEKKYSIIENLICFKYSLNQKKFQNYSLNYRCVIDF